MSIKEEEQDMLHFLWFDKPEQDRPRIARFWFNQLLFGLWPSPLILQATIAYHLRLYKPELEMAVLLKIILSWPFAFWSRNDEPLILF